MILRHAYCTSRPCRYAVLKLQQLSLVVDTLSRAGLGISLR